MKKVFLKIIIVFNLFFCGKLFSQERLGLISENYAGINNVFINPANSAHTPYQLDLNFGSMGLFLNNRVLNVPNSSFGNVVNQDSTHFTLAPFKYGSGDVSAWFKLPSLAIRFENFTVGIFSNARLYATAKNFPNEFAKNFLHAYNPANAGATYLLKQHEFVEMNWQETGINFSRIANYYTRERLYFGVNLKYLYKGSGFYYGSDNAYTFNVMDSLHYNVPAYGGLLGTGDKGWGISADLGIKFVKYEKGKWFDKSRNENEKLTTNYIFSAGISIVDLGWMKFLKGKSTQFNVQNVNVLIDTSVINHIVTPDPQALLIASMGNMMQNIQQSSTTVQSFSMQLPTAFSGQFDYHPIDMFYVNSTMKIPLLFFNGGRMPAAGMFSITPRFETKKIMAAIPLSLYRWREPTVGVAIRYKGITAGSDVLLTGNRTKGFNHFNFYASFKLSLEEMEHSFLKPPVPPPIRLLQDTIPLAEGGYMNKFSFSETENAQIYYSKNSIRADTVFIEELGGARVGKLLAATRPQNVRWYKPWKYGFGYHMTTTYKIKNLKTGIYVFDKKIPFIVKPKDEKHEIIIVIPTNEFEANNLAGGKSLHDRKKTKKEISNNDVIDPGRKLSVGKEEKKGTANIVSFQRPLDIKNFENLIPLLIFFRSDTSFHVGFISEKDLDNATVLKETKLIIVAGNSSHWTRKARTNFDKFIDRGGNAIVVSQDFMHWQVRYKQKGTQMICYKKKLFDLVQDPYLKTTTWDDPKLNFSRPTRIDKYELNSTGLSDEKTDSLFNSGITFPIVKTMDLTKIISDKFEFQDVNEKNSENELLLFGEKEETVNPVFIGKKKVSSGYYIQTGNLSLLNISDSNTKSLWYAMIRKCLKGE